MRVRTEDYLDLRFQGAGRARPFVDCWGLYRLIVGETTGIWLAEFAGVAELKRTAGVVRDEQVGGDWRPVAAGAERALDLVLMRGIVRDGSRVTAAPVHVGCVIEEGRMIDIEEVGGVRIRAFRDTARVSARPDVANRVVQIFRPGALA